METIQVVLDARLLQATDRVARRRKTNRSALIRDAIRAHLRSLEIRDLEERDRKGYQAVASGQDDELLRWEAEAAWPVD
ncbi:MAG: ribbon-helix-helix protein, CopG family [Bryobacteraceae bacterium]|jgi:metal-responsive CopG/Arc/MetJ family transcriptional regulator